MKRTVTEELVKTYPQKTWPELRRWLCCFTSCVTLAKLLNISVPLRLGLTGADKSADSPEWLSELISVKHWESASHLGTLMEQELLLSFKAAGYFSGGVENIRFRLCLALSARLRAEMPGSNQYATFTTSRDTDRPVFGSKDAVAQPARPVSGAFSAPNSDGNWTIMPRRHLSAGSRRVAQEGSTSNPQKFKKLNRKEAHTGVEQSACMSRARRLSLWYFPRPKVFHPRSFLSASRQVVTQKAGSSTTS